MHLMCDTESARKKMMDNTIQIFFWSQRTSGLYIRGLSSQVRCHSWEVTDVGCLRNSVIESAGERLGKEKCLFFIYDSEYAHKLDVNCISYWNIGRHSDIVAMEEL